MSEQPQSTGVSDVSDSLERTATLSQAWEVMRDGDRVTYSPAPNFSAPSWCIVRSSGSRPA
ncbi:hypothetical protein BK004_03745 [bacterium CG10_46_32]|nr:MAG: hypothetical protein BK004_03745 [bacterium CG10_46_32]PIR55909.1 MAG: hypothetical protein COU73_03775 [Parcubacteria group bacterium CG10_big_fil_rev_8_21_14_0_10_46_32]